MKMRSGGKLMPRLRNVTRLQLFCNLGKVKLKGPEKSFSKNVRVSGKKNIEVNTMKFKYL